MIRELWAVVYDDDGGAERIARDHDGRYVSTDESDAQIDLEYAQHWDPNARLARFVRDDEGAR